MSTLVENVAKVTAAHAALKEAIAAKGVAVPEGTKLSGMPALVEQIQTEPVPTNDKVSFQLVDSTTIVVPNILVVDINAITNLGYFFTNCYYLETLTLPDGFGQNATNIDHCFSNCRALKSLTLPDGFGQNATNIDYCFNGCKALKSLTLPDGFGQNSTTNKASFSQCSSLEIITGNPKFKARTLFNQSPKLTHDSLMVVINGLQTVTTTQELVLGATNLAKLTDEDKKVATDKGWTLA